MESLCRLCLQEHSQLKDIYQKYNQYVICELINRYIPEIHLNEKDNLSRLICEECLDVLCKIDRLRMLSIDNEKIQRTDIKIKIEVSEIPVYEEDESYELKPRTAKRKDKSSNEKIFSCFHCDRGSFKEKVLLEAHLLKMHKELPTSKTKKNQNNFCCFICEQNGKKTSFTIKARLQEHILIDHLKSFNQPQETYFQCEKCDDSFLFQNELAVHSFYIHNVCINEDNHVSNSRKRRANALKCDKCDIQFKKAKDLSFHNNIHEDFVLELPNDIPMKYECALCAFNSTNEDDLYQHLPIHTKDFTENPSRRIIVCINCSTIIKDYEALRAHLSVHNSKLTHECLKCNKKFPIGPRLLRHIWKHRKNEKLKCDYKNCTFKCATRTQMKDHVKVKHENEVIHLCQTCGQSFTQAGSLRNHIRNIHEKNNYIYQCEKCPMVFRVPSHLRNHQAVHTTEYNFKCEHQGCTKVFRAKRNLKLHQRYHDRSQLNYKFPCNFCERKFLTREAARRHSYTHTKVKPYACTVENCDRAFSQSNDLNKHLRTHFQQEETYFCKYEDCKQSFRLKAELRFHEGQHYQSVASKN